MRFSLPSIKCSAAPPCLRLLPSERLSNQVVEYSSDNIVGNWEEPSNIWLTAAKNTFVGWALTFGVRMLLKSAISNILERSWSFHLCKITLQNYLQHHTYVTWKTPQSLWCGTSSIFQKVPDEDLHLFSITLRDIFKISISLQDRADLIYLSLSCQKKDYLSNHSVTYSTHKVVQSLHARQFPFINDWNTV